MNQWLKINQKLDCLLEISDLLKIPNKIVLNKTKNLLIYLYKNDYPAPNHLTIYRQEYLDIVWQFDLVYINIRVSMDSKQLKCYFDQQLILEKGW